MATAMPQADPTSVVGRRVIATILDALLVLIPVVALSTSSFEYLTVETLERQGTTGADFCDQYLEDGGMCADLSEVDGVEAVYFADDTSNAPNLLWLVLTVGLVVVLQGFTGWTPGKLVAGIRVVRGSDGGKPGVVKALQRWVAWLVDGFPFFIPCLTGFIVALTTPGHRRVGDMWAKTFVVKRAAVGTPIEIDSRTGQLAVGTAPSPPLEWGTPPPSSGSVAGWGPAVDPTSVPPPTSFTPATPPNTAPAEPTSAYGSAPAGVGGPQWDEARGTYIQWDPAVGTWMQWDEGSPRVDPHPRPVDAPRRS